MAPPVPDDAVEALGLPLVVKPSKQGSTVGLTMVKDADKVRAAVDRALAFDDEAVLETFIAGRELSVGVLDDRALAVGEIRPQLSEIFDYASKYQPAGPRKSFRGPSARNHPARPGTRPQGASRRQGRSVQPSGLSPRRGRSALVPRGEHRARHDANEPPAAIRGRGRHQLPPLCERICQLAIERFTRMMR
jgi:D-alanine-D-alanine ligase